MPGWGLLKFIETKLQTTFLYLILTFFKKQKVVWNKSPCLTFCIIFKEIYFSEYILLIDQVSLSGCLQYYLLHVFNILLLFKSLFILHFSASFQSKMKVRIFTHNVISSGSYLLEILLEILHFSPSLLLPWVDEKISFSFTLYYRKRKIWQYNKIYKYQLVILFLS